VATIWETQALRVTFFPQESTRVASDWWKDFTGIDPDSETFAPKEQVASVSGIFADAHVSLVSGLGRVDLVFQPRTAVPADGTQFAVPNYSVGASEALLKLVSDKIGVICTRMPSVKRVAVAGTFLKETASLNDAYVELQKLLKSVTVQPEKMRELIFRVNWPVKVGDHVLNRIGVWAAATITVQAMTVGASDRTTILTKEYVSFEFDCSTLQDPEARLTPAECEARISELIKLVKENMERGEVVSA
jgi:hypothetical protein